MFPKGKIPDQKKGSTDAKSRLSLVSGSCWIYIPVNCHEFSTINPVVLRFPKDTTTAVFQIRVVEASADTVQGWHRPAEVSAERYRKNALHALQTAHHLLHHHLHHHSLHPFLSPFIPCPHAIHHLPIKIYTLLNM